jgi:hypothetical protein
MARYEEDYDDDSKEQACFIATATYGTSLSEEIDILRQFRDEFLITNPVGRALVAVYYKLSPPVAGVISRHRTLRSVVRECLVNPAVALSKSIRSRRAN